MPIFDHNFVVNEPLEKVAAFHRLPSILKQLTPFPIIVQVRRFDPLAEGSIADFTLWFGPLPIHWIAVHTGVDYQRGFVDTQQSGPLKSWVHTHTFVIEGDNATKVYDHIEYEHHSGLKGLLTRLLFPKVGLLGLFTYRKMVTRWGSRDIEVESGILSDS
ncbi:MAG: cyclase [Chloroflexota bacterium]